MCAEWAEEGAGVKPTDTDRNGGQGHSGGHSMISEAITHSKNSMDNATFEGSVQIR